MFETEAELAEIQTLLDTSWGTSTSHLKSIVLPGERTLTAAQLVHVTSGMCTLALATVTAAGEPRISGADGHFLHGRWVVGTARHAAKARQLAARSGISVAYMRGEEIGIFTHGRAIELNPVGGEPDREWPFVLDHLAGHYGESPEAWDGDGVVYYRVEPHWMVAYSADPERLVAGAELPR